MASLFSYFSSASSSVELLRTVFRKSTFRSIVVFFLVLGLQRIFEKAVFKCPDVHNRSYGAMFIIGPALCLFNIAMLLNSEFWDLVTGCYKLPKRVGRKRRICKRLIKSVFQSSLPAVVWLCLSLVDGNYYVCARLGQREMADELANGDKEKLNKVRADFAHARAESQLLAWGIFLSLVIISTCFVLIRRCCCLETEGILPNTHTFDQIEAETAAKRFKEKMEEEARKRGQEEVDRLFSNDGELALEVEDIRKIREYLASHYPRTTGDLSQPYRVETEDELKTYQMNGHMSSV